MDTSAYSAESDIEEKHWWFVGRRKILANIIKKSEISPSTPTLDIGSSSGTNLRLLKELSFTNYRGLDLSDEAIALCAEKGLGHVEKGDACDLPFTDGSFPLVIATDILEHLVDDRRGLSEIYRVMPPGGTAIIMVPAFPSLWGLQDEISHHQRRYRKGPLLAAIADSGLQCVDSYHFNYLLFFPIWLARQIIRRVGVKVSSEGQINSPSINRLLGLIFTLDINSAPCLRPPFGVSILAIVKRPQRSNLAPCLGISGLMH